MTKEQLTYNWGINDIENSCKTVYYGKWSNMIERVKHEPYLIKQPTYRNCDICEEWKYLSNFKKWFDTTNYINGYVLDKDLYIPNNKIYSPDTCLFIPKKINDIIKKTNVKGYDKLPSGNFRVRMRRGGISEHLGVYKTEIEAYNIYIQAKAEYIINIADGYWDIDEKIAIGLYRNAEDILGNNWKITLDTQ